MKILFLRVDDDLHEFIEKLAVKNDRSINKQAVRMLKKQAKKY